MKSLYQCEFCGKIFYDKIEALKCEQSHTNEDLKLEMAYKYCIINKCDLCSICEHQYLVYGCESACNYEKVCYVQNRKNFELKKDILNNFNGIKGENKNA